jgi:hypothetical protein
MAGFIDNIVHEGLIILSIVLLHINRHCMPVSDANRRKKRGVAIISDWSMSDLSFVELVAGHGHLADRITRGLLSVSCPESTATIVRCRSMEENTPCPSLQDDRELTCKFRPKMVRHR